MNSPTVKQRPWVAALVALGLTPIIGMLYLRQGLWAITYLLMGAWVLLLPSLAAHFQLLPVSLGAGIALLGALYAIAGALHCFLLAGKSSGARSDDRFLLPFAALAMPLLLAVMPKVLWEPYNLPSSSMEPGLQVGDYIFVSKFFYHFAEPQRGDIAALVAPAAAATAYVKRLIGLPGDRLQKKAGWLYLNGERLNREEVQLEPDREGSDAGKIYRETLPGGRSYLIREVSDSMHLDDTELFEVPPGHYFFLGDSRDNSLDSRLLQYMGYVPREHLRGRLAVVVWNMESLRLRLFDAVD